MIDSTMPLFSPDYIISWDFSASDFPCVSVSKLKRDKKGGHIEAEVLGVSHKKCGCISLRQVIEDYEAKKRADEKRMKDAENLRKSFSSTTTTNE